MAARKYYLHIRQSRGGIYCPPFQHGQPAGEVTQSLAIGTTECRTCVGVYFPIEESTFFAAHIDGQLGGTVPDDSSSNSFKSRSPSPQPLEVDDPRLVSWTPTVKQGEELRDVVLERLWKMFPQFRSGYPAELKDQVIIVCPFTMSNGNRLTGSWIAEAFKTFLGVSRTTKEMQGHGFLIDYSEKPPTRHVLRLFEKNPETYQSGYVDSEGNVRESPEPSINYVTKEDWRPMNKLPWFYGHNHGRWTSN